MTFPEPPEGKHFWAPIYYEPIMCSGERITIAIAAIADTGETMVVPTFHPMKLRGVLGGAVDALTSQMRLVLHDLEAHLMETQELKGWIVPLSGVFLGEIRQAPGRDLPTMVSLAITQTSFLGDPRRITNLMEVLSPPTVGTA